MSSKLTGNFADTDDQGNACIADFIRSLATEKPGDIALVFEGRETSYQTLDNTASQIANALIAEGLKPGDRVGFLGKNSDLYFGFWPGAIKAGLVLVSINWRLAPPEIAYILKDSAPDFLLCDPEFLPALADDEKCKVVTTAPHPQCLGIGEWIARFSTSDPKKDAGFDDTVLQLYTSGTSGHPKGALLTNRSLIQLREQMAERGAMPDWYRWTAQDVSLIAMPVFHISGSGWALWSLMSGGKGVIVAELNPAQVFDLLVSYQITKVILVPTAIRIVCDHPDAEKTDFSFLKYIYYGGSSIPLDLLRQAIAVFGCGVVQLYGMTETAGTIACLPPEDHDPEGNERMRGIGKPLPGVEIKIIAPDGSPLPTGEVGEIVTRSAANFAGYHNLPEATATTLDADGWLYTGDAGRADKDGYLYIADRIKDMIISGGENVYPAEVENALFSHPQVKDVAVIGVPDPKWGEAVKAVVVPTDGEPPTPETLIQWARDHIAGYKIPKSISFQSELPRNPSGKVLRRVLRDQYRDQN